MPSRSDSTFALTLLHLVLGDPRSLEVMKAGISLPEDAPIIGVVTLAGNRADGQPPEESGAKIAPCGTVDVTNQPTAGSLHYDTGQ
jgi:hypothetical protein